MDRDSEGVMRVEGTDGLPRIRLIGGAGKMACKYLQGKIFQVFLERKV